MEIRTRTAILLNDNCNACRVCLTTNRNNQYIFGAKQHDTIDVPEKLRLCCGVEVQENDGLPSTICTKCISKVNDAHELRKKCQQSDIRLRELYGKAYNTNPQKTMKDQYCQTDHSFDSNIIKVNDTFPNYEPSPMVLKDTEKCDAINETKCIIEEGFNIASSKQNIYVKCKEPQYKKNVAREAYRTRRMTMFKRMTSIENLRNYKERQRKYIKKNAKRDGNLGDVKKSDSQTSYICPKCSRCYSSKRSFDRHVSTHDGKSFTCDECGKYFVQLKELIEHNKLHVVKEKPKLVLCKICNKNFKKTDTMVRHLNVHKRVNPKEVLSILKEIREKRKLENILEPEISITEVENNNDGKGTIEKCAINESATLNALTNEILECENKETNVEYVDNKTESICSINEEHCRNKKSLRKCSQLDVKKKFVCTVCNMKFYRQDRLNSHKSRYGHDDDSASLEVQKPFDDKSAIKLINTWIREELDSDNEEKGFPCKTCGKSYDTKKSLFKHLQNVHNEKCTKCGKICTCDEKEKIQQKPNKKSYRCDKCDKSFENELKLQKHLRIHERAKEQQDVNFKRFLCHICSKTFRQNTGLMFHMRTHTGYKPHVCKYCGRGFTSNSNCINHERTHTGDRPFVCHFCSAAFAKSCTLKAHITTHTGEANYHCKTCGKSFRRLKYLKEHEFTHTGEKPYACKICGTAYSHSGSLFVHEKKCKAQYNTYQPNSTPNAQSYCNSETSSPNVTPLITGLPQTHLNNINVLNTESSKTYIDNVQRLNSQNISNVNPINAPDLHTNSNADIPDVSLAVKNFALIGQMF
ncbi:oocyte zinc finger protein XlCOF6-like [Ceratina calcarata]|uniref:Oocyte zinc finger protein XlCOF6-like n=2 Tax=Ceratina calcarata TaxID=156304 RepID=A0AAJ7N642_9HYME|nr:oocyte zinc finger protein XlCOF6-like [Ceratina calcarata]